jgi:nucleoside-diphosphate-sugar epimerase
MKVLFIGGTGTISSEVSKLAVQNGFELYLLNRGNRSELAPSEARLITCDIRDEENAKHVLKNYEFDVVVDWVCYNPEQVKSDIKLFKGKTDQYIFISSATVYKRPPEHYLVDESVPLSNPHWPYANDKIACEEILMKEYRESGFPVTIVRPSYTYSKTTIPHIFNSHKYHWTIIDRMRKGKKLIVPGDGTSLQIMTHSADLAKGFLGLLGNKQAIGQSFQITSDEVLTWNKLTNIMGEAAGAEPDIFHISSDFVCAFSEERRGQILSDTSLSIVYDNSKIKSFVSGYKASIPFAEGIKQSIDWYDSHPGLRNVDEDFNKLIDKIISAYETGLKMA